MSSLWSHWSEERNIVGRFICQINGSDKCCRCVGRETFSTLTYLKFVSILCLSQMNVANLLGEGSLRTSPCRNFHLCRWYRLSLRFGMVNMITVARRSPSVVLLFQVTLTECEAIRFPTSNNWPRIIPQNFGRELKCVNSVFKLHHDTRFQRISFDLCSMVPSSFVNASLVTSPNDWLEHLVRREHFWGVMEAGSGGPFWRYNHHQHEKWHEGLWTIS